MKKAHFIVFEALKADGGAGSATAPTSATAVDNAIDKAMRSALMASCKAEKYPKGADYCIMERSRGVERFTVNNDGVYSEVKDGRDKESGEQKYSDPVRICGRIDVLGKSRNTEGGNWGRVISFKDGEGREHRMTLSMSEIVGGGDGLNKKLADAGLTVLDTSTKNNSSAISRFLNSFDERDLKTIKTVDGGGWSDESYSCFVFENHIVRTERGDMAELSATAQAVPIKTRGALADWQTWFKGVAPFSDRLAFAILVSLASPLLPIVGDMSRAFHFYGGSSTGKTSAVKAAATVWGAGADWVRSWNATKNAPAALAKQYNNLPLIFDELKAARGVVNDVSYILSSGKDRARCDRNGNATEGRSWSLYCLSTGEGSLTEIKRQTVRGVDSETATGELVRFIDIPAVANMEKPENGIFDRLPDGVLDVEERRQWIDSYCNAPQSYGTAGTAFLEALERDIEENGLAKVRQNLDEAMQAFSGGMTITAATTARVLKAFAIVAAAGELAQSYGVLPWASGEAFRVAKSCFSAWRESADTLEDREDRFVENVLDDSKRCKASYTHYDQADTEAKKIIGQPVGSQPSFGALLIRKSGGIDETVGAVYSGSEFSDLLARVGGGLMKGEALAILRKRKRLLFNKTDRKHYGLYRAPKRKEALPLGMTQGGDYRIVVVTSDYETAKHVFESLGLPAKEA